MDRKAEVRVKQAMVADLLQREGLEGVLLSRRDNFSWLTAGAVNHIPLNEETGVASLLVTPEKIMALTTNIEARRMLDEEVGALGIEVRSWPWHEHKETEIHRLIGSKLCGSDDGTPGTRNVAASLAPLRYSLLPGEQERYRLLGHDAAGALECTARQVAPGMTEYGIAALVAKAVIEAGMEPTVNLVAVDERVERYRHPIPTGKAMERYAMLVLCARRGGLVVAATRLVHVGPLPAELRRRHHAVCQVELALYSATRPGVPVSAALKAGIAAYAAAGYPDEWELHHQGGPTGYNNREYLATPHSIQVVQNHQAFAWNPSITGTKNEDTILVSDGGVTVVTAGKGDWPVVKVHAGGIELERPDVLVK